MSKVGRQIGVRSSFVLFMLGLFVLKLSAVIWGLNKGIDILDEGWYMLSYSFPNADDIPFHEFHTIISSLFGWLGLNIVSARILQVVFEVTGTLIFAFGVFKWNSGQKGPVENSNFHFMTLFSFALLASFLSIFSRSISYVDLNYFCVLSASGLYFISARKTENGKKAMSLQVAIGFLLGMMFFIKFSSALILFVVLLFLFVIELSKSDVLRIISLQLGGIVLATFTFFLMYGSSPANWIERYAEGYVAMQILGYDIWTIVSTVYIPDLLVMLVLIVPSAMSFFLLIHLTRKLKNSMLISLAVSTLVFWVINLIYNADVYPLHNHPVEAWKLFSVYFYVFLLIVLAGGYFYTRNNLTEGVNLTWSKLNIFRLAFLFLLPYIIIVGSDSEFFLAMYMHLVPWMVLIYLLIQLNLNSKSSSQLAKAAVVLTLVATQVHFVYGFFVIPYGLPQNITKQDQILDTNSSLLVDTNTYEFVIELKRLMDSAGYEAGDSIIAIYNLPGIVYLLDGYPLGTSWYFGVPDAFNCHHLKRIGARFGPVRPWLLLKENVSQGVLSCLTDSDIGYPEKFVKVGEVRDSYSGNMVRILKYK